METHQSAWNVLLSIRPDIAEAALRLERAEASALSNGGSIEELELSIGILRRILMEVDNAQSAKPRIVQPENYP